ncbi:MAG: GDP-L-fucose synthase [Xanthobacteraceae bacterium]
MSEAARVIFPLAGKRVWVAGHRGMVGSALVRRLEREACTVLTVPRKTLDLRRQGHVEAWLLENRPDAIFIAAATVGGILANSTRPAEFLYDNLAIAANIIHGAVKANVAKLMFLGAACLYPRLAPQPMSEDSLLTGPPEPTNEWYTVAKIAGVKLCQAFRAQHGCDFIVAVPANLYGPGDNFDATAGHVVPGLIRRAHEAGAAGAPSLPIWGTGKALREFIHVDDCADALVFLMKAYSDARMINVGTGEEVSIGELARKVCGVVGYAGELTFDISKPDGMPRKLLDSSRVLAMGWRGRVGLDDGLRQTYQWFLEGQRVRSGELTA